jgi:hypothetical protein
MQNVAHPGVIKTHTDRLDAAILSAMGQCIQQPLGELNATDTTLRRVRMPRRFYGGAVRSQSQVAPAAWLGGALVGLSSLPDRVTSTGDVEPGFAPALGAELLGAHSFDDGNQSTRFRHFLATSDSPTAGHFQEAWDELRRETALPGADGPTEGPLSVPAEGAGCVDGEVYSKPQHQLTVQREGIAFETLNKDIMALPPRDQRRLAWMGMGTFSTPIIGVTPLPGLVLTNAELAESHAQYYGLESPACRGLVDRPIRKTKLKLDRYGNNLTTASTPGDGWRKHHDEIKLTLFDELRAAKVDASLEVMGLFAPLIAQSAAFTGQTTRARQAMVPDLLVEQRGSRLLADVKTLHVGKTTYLNLPLQARNTRGGAVQRRQDKVNKEYAKKAEKVDSKFNGTPQGQQGPVAAKLSSFGRVHGLIFGAFGDVSKDVVDLVHYTAEHAAPHRWREMGAASSKDARNVLHMGIRRRIAVTCARGHARLKLDRLAAVTGDAFAGEQRRGAAAARAASDRWWYWQANNPGAYASGRRSRQAW